MDRSGESMNPKDKHADWLLKPTANELADIQAFKTEELTIWERNTTATMLRQQQSEIEALKELNTMLKDAIEKRIGMDAERYKWLRAEFAAGRETYIGEWMPSGEDLDKYIDGKAQKK